MFQLIQTIFSFFAFFYGESNVMQLSVNNFDQFIANNSLVVVHFCKSANEDDRLLNYQIYW